MPKPYTVTFGPWSPDLQNVGVEMPMQWSETELPVADCQNVYYQDGAYRCLPAAAPTGPTLGTPITNAFTWYDDTEGDEITFATTANGIFQLLDGVWTQVPLQLAPTVGGTPVGMLVKFLQGSVTALAYAATPLSETGSGTLPTNTFGVVKALIGQSGASGYTWGFTAASGGTFSIASGQGTASATPAVAGVSSGATATANLACTFTFNGHSYTTNVCALSYTRSVNITHTYTSGSGAETIPSGASQVVIECWGASGGSQGGHGTGCGALPGGGGASGGYSRTTVTGLSSHWGQTFNYGVGVAGAAGASHSGNGGPGGASSVSTGSGPAITTLADGGGGGGITGTSAAGTATGGTNANTAGHGGTTSGAGAGIVGVNGTGSSGGFGGSGQTSPGTAGGAGLVIFHYT